MGGADTMTTDLSAAFLRAICEDPHDHGTRLIYADWLEDHGQGERAELIRVQCEMGSVPSCRVEGKVINWAEPMRACRVVFPEPHMGKGQGPHCDPCRAFVRLHSRERKLLCPNFDAWHGLPRDEHGRLWDMANFDDDDPEHEAQWRALFRRGFIEHVELPTAAFLEHAEALFRAAPIISVRLTDREPAEWANGIGWMPVYHPSSDDQVPWPIAEYLEQCGCRPHVDNGLLFYFADSAAAAHAALNAACVTYGRRLVGLADLPREPAPEPA
jgi:uncharacterized protein (TIGR02996 family)